MLASSIRLDEIIGAGQYHKQTTGAGKNVARVIQSICHDGLTADRELGYQALGMILLPTIWNYLACEVAAVGIFPKYGASSHTYPACPTENESLIFPISYHGHMMWGQPTAATTCATRSD